MRVVSWNVRSLRDGRRAVGDTLRRLEPDVVVLQEAPRLVLWRLSRHLLARRAGLRVATSDRAAGNLVLARVEVERSWAQSFARPKGLHRRGTAGVVVRLDGRPLAVVGTHLDLEPAARVRTALAVRALVPDLPLVLGADVNELPGGAAWSVLAAGLVDAGAGGTELGGGASGAVGPAGAAAGPAGQGARPTFPARAAVRRIDLLAASPCLCVTLRVQETSASDHLVLVADVSWSP